MVSISINSKYHFELFSFQQEMIDELGEDLYNKYSAQIFSLKFYEDNLFTHS